MKQLLFLLLSAGLYLSCTKEGNSSAKTTTGSGGSMARFTIVNNYLYSVDKQNLNVFNISDAANPQKVKTIAVGFEIETIFPFKDKLFIGSTSVVHIFSLDMPDNPVKLSEAISPTVMRRCDPVVAKDTVAYATLRTNVACGGGTQSILAVYNIKDVTKPVQVTSRDLTEPLGLGYQDSALYVCDAQRGLIVFNISQAFNPVFKTEIQNGQYFIDVIPYNDLLICWTKSGMSVFNITNRFQPVLLSSIN
ncbi:MAG: hypothetical protein SFU21_11980 [Flavihumibacter sp.]|nr:hypothetical protein [Flavihumibacter sp.]